LFQLSGHPGEPIAIRLEIDRFTETEPITVDSVQNIYQAVIGKHAASIVDETPMDGADALHNLELVLGCYASANQHGALIKFD